MARTIEVSIPATRFIPATSNGAALVAHTHNTLTRPALAFDASTDESAISVPFVMPDSYTGGVVKVDVYFYSASASSGTAAWNVALEAVTPSADTLDLEASSSIPTGTGGTHTVSGTAGDLRKLSINLDDTADDGVAAGDHVRLGIFRDESVDSVSGDLYLALVILYEG